MRLGIKPSLFLLRALIFFALTYALWAPFAAPYTGLLAALVQGFLHLTELSSDPYAHQVTTVTADGTALFFRHRLFPQAEFPGIPAEWVQANLVLLIPLMLATPAATWALKAKRFALAMVLAVAMQVLDIAVTVKATYSVDLGDWSFRYYSDAARWTYQLADAFTQSMDTQLFPFVIWAGIHFRLLVGARLPRGSEDASPGGAVAAPRRADARRAARSTKRPE